MPATPVFVDDSGRRHRIVRILGWTLGALVIAYLGLLGVSLVGSPGLVPLSLPSLGQVLPGPAAARLPRNAQPMPAVTVTPSPRASAAVVSPEAARAVVPARVTLQRATVASPSATPSPSPSARRTTTATVTATPASTTTATPTSHGSSTTQSSKPSTRPTPHSTHAASGTAQ